MAYLTRGEFLKLSLLSGAAGVLSQSVFAGNLFPEKKRRIPVIHSTDLYHFHNDPDDHWDLATQYALACHEEIELLGVLLDYPVKPGCDPDVMGIAMMNYLTGKVVPAVTGTPFPMKSRNDVQPGAGHTAHQGIQWLLESLHHADSPVVIHVTGAATSVAVALKKEPSLFARKCRAIYLSAGSANGFKDQKLEYNVKLDPFAFAALFDAPCPLFWMPCTTRTNIGEVGEYGTYYRFTEGEILSALPPRLQNFFLFMLEKKQSHEWFSFLNNETDPESLSRFSKTVRHMWSTAGFLHAAGKTVTTDGGIIPLSKEGNPVFSFIPVNADCNDLGFVDWKADPHAKKRFIFHVDNVTRYQHAMTSALKETVMRLPD